MLTISYRRRSQEDGSTSWTQLEDWMPTPQNALGFRVETTSNGGMVLGYYSTRTEARQHIAAIDALVNHRFGLGKVVTA